MVVNKITIIIIMMISDEWNEPFDGSWLSNVKAVSVFIYLFF